MKKKYILLLLFIGNLIYAQTKSEVLSFEEFLGYVKTSHPLTKQANLKISEAQANLMKARGGFDPKLEADYTEKEYSDNNYYSIFNGSFKIPTWYGIEVKAAFDNNEGIYLNPENTLPNSGLTSLGISVPIGQGLWINERMAELRKAKIYQRVNEAERKIMLTEVIYEASQSYINWKRTFDEVELYKEYLKNASIRYSGVLKLIEEGDKPAIDSIEAGITVKSRKLNLENSKLKLIKAKLLLSNYLWSENGTPFEVEEFIRPEEVLDQNLLFALKIDDFQDFSIQNHPKIEALNSKLEILNVETKLAGNSLLPKLDVNYNYLSEPSAFDNYRLNDYKFGVNFSFPLFLRKERANLKLAKIKVAESQFEVTFEQQALINKIEGQKNEINSYRRQIKLISDLVVNYNQMLNAEERLFQMGESSLFLINSRENTLVTAQLTNIALTNNYLQSALDLYKTMANPE
ncbi:TolC family protein [Flavobacterium sp.]|jgi:outer membrane protein TolC|uniref:TolC family protein n=1 Tax=Flavobacterium sp. TaxID=239 RepID=UPI002A80B1F2|nr:TolC family protein [Flavobacterium sp.]